MTPSVDVGIIVYVVSLLRHIWRMENPTVEAAGRFGLDKAIATVGTQTAIETNPTE